MGHGDRQKARMQTTPRYDSTFAVSHNNNNLEQILKRLKASKAVKAGTATSKLSTPDPEEDTVVLGEDVNPRRGFDSDTILMGLNKLLMQDYNNLIRHRSDRESEHLINQSDLSRCGGLSAINDEFMELKNRRVNFSTKKNNFAKNNFSGFNTSLPLNFNDAGRDDSDDEQRET